MFYHAPTCPCGNCHGDPGGGPTHVEEPCGCVWDDGNMDFCEEHEELATLRLANGYDPKGQPSNHPVVVPDSFRPTGNARF